MRSVDFEFEKGRGETKDLFESDFIGQINTRDPKYKETWDEMAKEELRKYELGEWKRRWPAGQKLSQAQKSNGSGKKIPTRKSISAAKTICQRYPPRSY